MGSLSVVHWLIVIIVVFLLFGSGRIPGMIKGLGDGIREFKKAISDNPQERPAAKEFEPKANRELAVKSESQPRE